MKDGRFDRHWSAAGSGNTALNSVQTARVPQKGLLLLVGAHTASTAPASLAIRSNPSPGHRVGSTPRRPQKSTAASTASFNRATSAALSWIGVRARRVAAERRSRAPSGGSGRRRRSRRSGRSPSRRRPGWRGRSSASACGSASACRDRSVEQVGTSKPVIHIAQTNTSRSGSSGSLNFSSRSSLSIRLRCGTDVEPLRRQVGDLVLALARRPPPCRSSPSSRSAPRARRLARRCGALGRARLRSRQIGSSQCSRTLSYMRTAVALSIATNIALPRKPRPDEVAHEVLGDPVQPVVARDQVVLRARTALERASPAPRRARPPRAAASRSLVEVAR